MRDEVIHARVQSDVKKEAEKVFNIIGLSMSQAINLFLKQVILKKGMPFELTAPEEECEDLDFATAIATVDGVLPSEDVKRIFRLYKKGEIDLETAKFAIRRLHQ